MWNRILTAFLGLGVALLGACGDPTSDNQGTGRVQGTTVFTVNYPLQYMAQRIAGDHLEVQFPAPDDVDPAFWTPTAEQVTAYQQADLIVFNGAGYAKWTASNTLPGSRTIDAGSGLEGELIEIEDAVVHKHGPEGDHAHTGTAFTTWLDPRLAIKQAEAIEAAMSQRWPDHAEDFRGNLKKLIADLTDLDQRIDAARENYDNHPILASHPVYQYLQRRASLNLHSLHWEPDSMPDQSQWKELDQWLAENPTQWMLWEGEPLSEIREQLQQRGVKCVVYDPCGNRPPAGEDFLSIMQGNVERLTGILEPAVSE